MEELQPSIQSGRSRFSVHDATGFSGHVSCSGLPGAPSTCSAWSSVSSSTDVYADMFRSFSGDREAPSVPFLEFSGDLEVEDIARISVDSYSDIFGGLGWDVEMSAEELMLGGLGFGAESKDVENDSLKKTRGERKPSQELPAEFVSYASEDSNGSLFYSWENITSKTKSQNVYNDEEQIQIPDKVFNHVDEGKFMDENDTIPVDSFSVFTSTDDGCYSSLEEHKKRATTLLDRLSVDSLPCVRGNNLEEGDCNRCARSDHVEMLSAYRQNSGNNNSCEPREVFLTVAEINLQTKPTKRPPPSRSPPQLETRESESKGSLDSSRKVYHENGIRKMVNRNQCDRATIGSSDIHVVEDSSKIPPCLDVGIDTNPYVSDSTHSTEEVRIEAKGEEKIPTHSSQTGRNTHGNMMSCAEDGQGSKQQNECKTIHESFESAETDSAVSNRQYRQDKVGRKTYQETQEPTEPLIKLKEEQQNYDYKNVFRISCDGIQFEASRRMRNAPLIIRKEVEVASLDKSSGEKAFEQDVLTRETSVLQTGGQAWKQTGETAMVDKVVLEARDCVEVELAEMQTTSSRDMENEDDQSESCDKPRTEYSMRHEPAFKQKNPPSDVSFLASETVTNRPEFESETEGRRKARLLRSQRTEERVAKALAEKKARDFLVQKEQAQRSRLAETLDGDIRRWSIGKEGNVRALLSTLQYILWPESGWQPVPLTEVITAAAVKKTYRKASLCVHPDKVQQKGANIQQKYIAEKVFYLLKDAWNKFNYEEC